MNILVTNDDGYTSPGLANLAVSMRAFGDVDVIAPKDDRSGSSCSITLDRPLRVGKAESGFAFVTSHLVDQPGRGEGAARPCAERPLFRRQRLRQPIREAAHQD